MVRYISAKKATSLNDILNEIAPDFNSKLSAILKKASQPTWDLEEIRSKAAEESDLSYVWLFHEDRWAPIKSTVKIYYRGITDTDKEFYVDITKTMCVVEFEDIDNLVNSKVLKLVTPTDGPDGTLYEFDYVNGSVDGEGETYEDEYYDDIVKDWDNWVDAPGVKAEIDLFYKGKDRIKEHYEVNVDQIDETIQNFVDKYVDGEETDTEQAPTKPETTEQENTEQE